MRVALAKLFRRLSYFRAAYLAYAGRATSR